jgi:type VII secretion-associated serine protease mycosin
MALFMASAQATPGMAAAAAPNPLPQQYWFTTWGVQDRLWPITQGKGVTVAVLDTGVQANIRDLSGVVLPGTDVSGSGGGDGRTDIGDELGHGTGMGSLIAAQGTGTGFLGVAPQAKILPVVIKGLTGAAQGIRYAADHGAKVINISQGSPAPCPNDVQQAVAYALSHDVVVVASAGNSGNAGNAAEYPGNCAGVMAVGGVDAKFNPWVGTQRQPYVAVAAPAANVGSVLRDGEFHTSSGGTSSSSALTSAVVALVRAKFPDMSAREVVQQIIGSAGDVGPKGKDNLTGYGLIRPYRILNGDVPKNGPNPVFDAYDKWAAAHKANSAPQNQPGSTAGGTSMTMIALYAAVALLVIGIIVFGIVRGRRRPQPAGPAPYGQQGMPQSFGGQPPYPQQGRPQQYPQQYQPPSGPGQQVPPPPQGQYPDPGGQGPWGDGR